jgi:hypothetical protein
MRQKHREALLRSEPGRCGGCGRADSDRIVAGALSAAGFHVRSGNWDALRDEKGERVQDSAQGVRGGAHVLGIVPRHELCGAHVELSVARSGRWLGVVSHVVGDGDGAGVAVVRFEDGDVLEFDLATVQCGRLSDKPPLGMQEVRELCARVCMVCGERGSYQACCSAVMCDECRRKLWQNQRDAVGELRSATPRAVPCPFCTRAEGEVDGEPSSTQRSTAPTERRRASSQALKADAGSAGPSLLREAARLSDTERGACASGVGPPARRSKRVLSRRV